VHPDTRSERRRLYLLARVVVSRHYRRPLTLAVVAQALSTSPRQLQRAYAQYDSSFQEDLYARRMAVAAQLLSEQPSIPVCDVGRLVGYPSAYFARAFRRRYGLSPALFRNRALRHAASAGKSARRGREGSSPPWSRAARERRPAPAARPPAV
jgi:AraC-like DNA-binding protein